MYEVCPAPKYRTLTADFHVQNTFPTPKKTNLARHSQFLENVSLNHDVNKK